MQNIPRWKKSDRGSSHFRHGLDPRLHNLPNNISPYSNYSYMSISNNVLPDRKQICADYKE